MANQHARNSELNYLHPIVRDGVIKIEKALNDEGIPFKIFEAYRYPERQADLYAQGRTTSGNIVTYAKPWQSYHQYGLAVDFVLFENGSWSWDDKTAAKKKWWQRMHELGKKYGLEPLNFETPHLQITGTDSNALIHGHYPSGADDLWSEHLAAAIAQWHGSPSAPPSPTVPSRPNLNQPPRNATHTLGTITNENFSCEIKEDSDGRVFFTADADIDADGANGQNGAIPAYKNDDNGSEFLANGGMKIVNGKVICAQSWAKDIVILDSDNEPKIFPNGVIASMTWYKHPNKQRTDPAAYVDAETIPYIVVPSLIIQKTAGVVRGCKARVSWQGKSVDCVVADKGPANKVGELSIAAARALGIPSSPRNGGIENPEVFYELWPGVAASGFVLQPA
jgi:hypothetical protein